MHNYNFKTHKGNISINHPTSLADVALRQWQEYMNLGEKEEQIAEKHEQLEFIIDPEDKQILVAEIFIERIELARERIETITPKSEHLKLRNLGGEDLLVLEEAKLFDPADEKPVARFVFPMGVQPDLALLKSKIAKAGFFERRKLKKRYKELGEGKFVVVPVAELEFRAKMALDRIETKSRGKMPEELQQWMNEGGYTERELANKLMESAGTPEQERDRLKRTKLLNKYARELERGEFRSLHLLLSHLCIPEGEQYSPELAQERAEIFLDLPMDIVMGVRSFFVEARRISTLYTRMFSTSHNPR